jgi:pyruvate dehydrogenase E1 component
MFGFQRVGDLCWAAGDIRARGFMLGGTAGRTTLNGEGLQHQDGHSHLLAYPVPNLMTYDPAYAYELAVIIQDGMKRMYQDEESLFYYLTVMNEGYEHPPMPEGSREGILKGMYLLRKSDARDSKLRAQLLGSGAILPHVVQAQKLLAEKFGVAADVWSVTSYKELYKDGIDTERWNMLHPVEKPRVPYVAQCLANAEGPVIAASDYVKTLPCSVAKWLPRGLHALGTDGFGRSDSRAALRNHFEVDARFVALAALYELARDGKIKNDVVQKAIQDLDINVKKPNPLFA